MEEPQADDPKPRITLADLRQDLAEPPDVDALDPADADDLEAAVLEVLARYSQRRQCTRAQILGVLRCVESLVIEGTAGGSAGHSVGLLTASQRQKIMDERERKKREAMLKAPAGLAAKLGIEP